MPAALDDDYTNRYRSAACGGDPQKLLGSEEQAWLEFRPILLSHGYTLCERMSPDWVPSWWKDPELSPYGRKDFGSCASMFSNFIHAYCVKDGSLVSIEKASTTPATLSIISLLNSQEFKEDERNHTAALLDSFPHPSNDELHFLVTPFLRDIAYFTCVGEIIDVIDQLLEGLAFMHENGVYHGDITSPNLAMNGAMFPGGVHPHHRSSFSDGETRSREFSRLETGVKYYYTHFDFSGYIHPDDPPFTTYSDRRRVPGYSSAPELSSRNNVNPFKLDVFSCGKCINVLFCEKYTNLGFLRPLLDQMMADKPEHRPTAQQALETWQEIRSGIWKIQAALMLHHAYCARFFTLMGDGVWLLKFLRKWFKT